MSTHIKNDYPSALKDFKKLAHVNDDQLRDGDISHLVFRAQHELDLLAEGERDSETVFTAQEERAIRLFIIKWGTAEEISRMNDDTPTDVCKNARYNLAAQRRIEAGL